MQGGNQEPKILEAKQLGFMDNGTGKHQSNTVYDENALCPNITTVEGGGTQQIKVCESRIVAMRGRNPDNPSDRTAGNPTEQRLEVNMQDTSNCLTSVQKDNLLLENVKIRQATKEDSIECEIGGCFDASYPNSKTRRGRVQDKGNTCPTLTAQNQEAVRIEKVGQISSDGSQCGTVISDNGISANLVAGTHGYANSHIATQYRIRKLTLTIDEAAEYSNIGVNKLREITNNPRCQFVMYVGKRRLIKRKEFEKYIAETIEI